MTPSICNTKCAENNFSYFGVQKGDECWCGNTQPPEDKQQNTILCNYKCAGGDGVQDCGGDFSINIWKVGDSKFSYE